MRVIQIANRDKFSFKEDNQLGTDTTFGTPATTQTSEPSSTPNDFMPGFVDIPAQQKTQNATEQSKSVPASLSGKNENLGVSASQVLPVTSGNTDSMPKASQGNSNTSSDLIGTQGAPFKTADAQTATTSTPVQPLPPKEPAFALGDLNPMWWLLLIPLILIPLMLFRFVMGTSSANELERYKRRGPTVEDPEAPNVRGRFKKKPRTDISKNDSADSNGGVVVSDSSPEVNASTNPDDELSFLDEAVTDGSIEHIPTVDAALQAPDPSAELDADLSGEPFEPGDFDPQTGESHDDLATANLSSPPSSSESKPLNDPSDSDLDFDFFSDDDDVQATDNVVPDGFPELAEPAEVTSENPDDGSAVENPANAETVPSISLDQPEESVSAVGPLDESDDDFDFFGDDSDDEFSLEDDDAAPAIAVSEAKTNLEEDAADAEVFEMDEPTEQSQDQSVETVVAATAAGAAAVAATTTAKGGSWMKRLFGGRKKKSRGEELPEDDAIAATAIKEPEDEALNIEEDVLDFDGVAAIEDDQLVTNSVASDMVPIEANLDQSDDIDFSDSNEAFSLEGDDSSDGMFEDDSDLDYRFDAEDAQKPEELESDSLANIEINDDDSIEDFASIMEEPDDIPANLGLETEASSDSFDAISLADDQPETVEPTELAASLAVVEPAGQAEEFNPIGHQSSSDELPLLEDQMLDEIVDSDHHVADAATATTGLTSGSEDTNDALLAELQLRIDELESQNSTMESERTSLMSELDELRDASENDQASAEEEQKLEELEKQLDEERQAKLELEEKLTAEAEAKKLAAEEAELARTEAETAKAEIEKAAADAEAARAEAETAKAESEKAAAEAAEFRQKAEEAVASARELEQAAESQSSSAGMLGGSLLAAAGGAAAGAAMSGGSDESAGVDDPFRLEPEQVKVMLKKLKDEKKKRRQTKEYFLQVDAKRREVTKTLKQVTGELDSLKQEFQKVTDSSTDSVSKETVKELMTKLSSAEDALKKNGK